MAIKKAWKGANIRKAGAYSYFNVDQSGGSYLTANDTLFIIGESSMGAPGDVSGIKSFSASQVGEAVAYYGKGPIVDALVAGVRPSSSSLIGGFGKVLVWKTNSSTQASVTLSSMFTIKAKDYGVDGNNIYMSIANGVADAARGKIITVKNLGETTEILPENAAAIQLSVYYGTACTTATMSIAGATKAAKTLTTSIDSGAGLSIPLATYTIKQLVDKINTYAGYTAALVNTSTGTVIAATDLDLVSSLNIKAIGNIQNLYRLQEEIKTVINENSNYIEATLVATPVASVPANCTDTYLTGGAQGASINTDFSDGMAKSLAYEYGVMVPLISQDYTTDITLGQIYDGGFVTDAGSTYTIASVMAAGKAHLILRSSIKNKKEAMGIFGSRNATKALLYAAAGSVASELVQVAGQDVKISDATGNLRWKQPHILAVMAAGIRLGSEIGEPLTHKYLNVIDCAQYVDMAGDESYDGTLNVDTDYDDIIDAGVMAVEKVNGSFRIMLDNTTYALDGSFVFNRGSVMAAAQYVGKTLRETCDLVFVGKKVSNGAASSVKSVLRNKMKELNTANILVTSIGAPYGFVEDTFIVTQTGNTTTVQVQVYPVQGMDFIFITFSLLDLKQSA